MTTKHITITSSFVGLHCWPSAPDRRAYLREPHRHLFNVKVSVSVEDSDREVEYHDLKDQVVALLPATALVMRRDHLNPYLNFSCEHHAERIVNEVALLHPRRSISVTVDEDGECGSTVTRTL